MPKEQVTVKWDTVSHS